ncbi:DUF4123 domain-containing protein [Chromobacterium subtsugae]|uniref:DUF4123 domain-containing protein n=1 Tax=Chromobacterium subtsugae TaxID=251747 RepID=UPI0007F876CC|nr:DUF4123 domain-containing protein [Chromobacterium subtsugae]OBU85244.1 hypothetical protein MY55_17195 [Chromobacterium subtsugae]
MFLQNRHAPELLPQLHQWMAINENGHYCWLMDGSQLDAKEKRWLQRRQPWQRALDDTPMDALEDFGPLIWTEPLHLQEWWPEWLAITSGRPLLSVVEFRHAVPDSAFWHWLSDFRTDDGQKLLLRFADTHTLANVLPLMSDEQLTMLASQVARWGWIGRTGEWEAATLRDTPTIPAPWEPLEFTQAQFDRMMDRARPDMLPPILAHYEVELPQDETPASLHLRLSQLAEAMSSYGIQDEPSQALFASLAFEQGDSFHQETEWQEFWNRTRKGQLLTAALSE